MTEISKIRSDCQSCQRTFLDGCDILSFIFNCDVSPNYMSKSCNILSDSEFAIIGIKNQNNTA